MSYRKIKMEMLKRGLTSASIARDILKNHADDFAPGTSERSMGQMISDCIREKKNYPKLAGLLRDAYGLPVAEAKKK